jgi:hypothetical protein
MKMKTFEMLEGYDAEYKAMLETELARLVDKKPAGGVTFKEDNMIFQLKTHLGIKVDLVSQRKTDKPKDKDIGIASYN